MNLGNMKLCPGEPALVVLPPAAPIAGESVKLEEAAGGGDREHGDGLGTSRAILPVPRPDCASISLSRATRSKEGGTLSPLPLPLLAAPPPPNISLDSNSGSRSTGEQLPLGGCLRGHGEVRGGVILAQLWSSIAAVFITLSVAAFESLLAVCMATGTAAPTAAESTAVVLPAPADPRSSGSLTLLLGRPVPAKAPAVGPQTARFCCTVDDDTPESLAGSGMGEVLVGLRGRAAAPAPAVGVFSSGGVTGIGRCPTACTGVVVEGQVSCVAAAGRRTDGDDDRDGGVVGGVVTQGSLWRISAAVGRFLWSMESIRESKDARPGYAER